MNRKDSADGMIVYHRNTFSRGVIHSSNQYTGFVTVRWDDGSIDSPHVSNLMSEDLYNQTEGKKKEEERLQTMSIKKEDCAVDSVVYHISKSYPLSKGKIVGPLDVKTNRVVVEWDNGTLAKVDYRQLLDKVTGASENQRLKDEEERLEREFNQVQKECADKLNKAAALITEASKLASSKKLNLQEMYEATSTLVSAMDRAGWNTSSWGC